MWERMRGIYALSGDLIPKDLFTSISLKALEPCFLFLGLLLSKVTVVNKLVECVQNFLGLYMQLFLSTGNGAASTEIWNDLLANKERSDLKARHWKKQTDRQTNKNRKYKDIYHNLTAVLMIWFLFPLLYH